MAISDAKRSSRWYGRLLNWIAYLLGYGAAEVMTRRPWELLRERLGDFHYEEWSWGFFYVSGGSVQNARHIQVPKKEKDGKHA